MQRLWRWEKAKERLKHYRRREPEKSALYRLVYHGREELPLVWEERFQAIYGVLRDEVIKTFDEYLNCGLLCHGAARAYCDTCRHSLLIAFSCKKRGVCPSCLSKRAVNFAEHIYEHVLEPVPHRHVVFTIPKRLRIYLRYDRSLNDILFRAAWGAVTEVLGGAGTPAMILTVQTAGEALNFHPHLHGLLADGVFGDDGRFVPFTEINLVAITVRFADYVLSALRTKGLITDEAVAQILSQEHTGFSVWLGDAFCDPERERFVARYIERGPVSLEKLTVEDDIVTYTTNDGRAHEFDALEFPALLSTHIPRPYESLTRYFGWYSCRMRGERKKREPLLDDRENEPDEPDVRPSSSWARCMKRIFEFDPLECPRCRGKMRIIAFLQDTAEISKIMARLGLPDFRAPPPIPKAELLELFQDELHLEDL